MLYNTVKLNPRGFVQFLKQKRLVSGGDNKLLGDLSSGKIHRQLGASYWALVSQFESGTGVIQKVKADYSNTSVDRKADKKKTNKQRKIKEAQDGFSRDSLYFRWVDQQVQKVVTKKPTLNVNPNKNDINSFGAGSSRSFNQSRSLVGRELK